MKNNVETSSLILPTNGLLVPTDFPIAQYAFVHKIIEAAQAKHPLYEHYAGAWNALSYRFRAAVDYGNFLVESLKKHGSTPLPEERYIQERILFDFFSSGFSVFESSFYGLYAIGAFISPADFSLASGKDQQHVTPNSTKDAFARAFSNDPIVTEFEKLFSDPEYQQWREIRNILTHRTAPGRRIYVSFGNDNAPATEWKLNNKPLDESIASKGRQELSRLLTHLLTATATFVETKFEGK